MRDLLTALALVLVIEGVLWALFPDAMRRTALRAADLPVGQLRRFALGMAIFGVALVWFIRA